jgi:hypothetical protein
MKTTLRALGALIAALITAGCGTMSVNPLVQFVDDAGTTTAIKTRLASEGGLSSMTAIGVETDNDMVRLTGTVVDDAERLRVERIARQVAGDNRVISDLRVAGSASASPGTPAPAAVTPTRAPKTPSAPTSPGAPKSSSAPATPTAQKR